MADIDLRQSAIDLAMATVKDLYARHEITDPNQAKRLAREKFTNEELERYKLARDLLMSLGAIG